MSNPYSQTKETNYVISGEITLEIIFKSSTMHIRNNKHIEKTGRIGKHFPI